MTDALTDALNIENQDDNNYFETLVGEGKKYKSVEDLAKAYAHASKHIGDLEDELDEMRQTKSTTDEILAELRNTKPKVEPDPTTVVPSKPAGDEKDITKIVREAVTNTLTEREKAQQFTANTHSLINKLVEHYGSKELAAAAINKFHAGKPQLRTMVDTLAGTDPDEAFSLVTNRIPKDGVVLPNTPGVDGRPSADGIVASVSGTLTWTQARDIKKKDPKKYNSKEFQDQLVGMVAKYQSQGKDFFRT